MVYSMACHMSRILASRSYLGRRMDMDKLEEHPMKRNRINTPRTRGKSPDHTKQKVPYKYPFATGVAYAKGRELGYIPEPRAR